MNLNESVEFARKVRKDVLLMTHLNNSSHVGSALSIVDILSVLYTQIMVFDSKNPKLYNRDRFILSKGHAGVALYSVLANLGFFDKNILKTHFANGSILSGHVSHKNIPGVELSTGSLGHGLSVAVGMALAAKLNSENHRIFVIVGDGELDEGSIWEALLFANHKKLDNLYVIIDHNKLQSLDTCENTIGMTNIVNKFQSFGWESIEVDGHNLLEIKETIISMNSMKPKCIIANTIKGKGISFMENKIEWHYKSPNLEQYEIALKELSK